MDTDLDYICIEHIHQQAHEHFISGEYEPPMERKS